MRVLAYLDAGSGSLLLQAIVGGVAGLAVFLRYRWYQLKALFVRNSETDPEA